MESKSPSPFRFVGAQSGLFVQLLFEWNYLFDLQDMEFYGVMRFYYKVNLWLIYK